MEPGEFRGVLSRFHTYVTPWREEAERNTSSRTGPYDGVRGRRRTATSSPSVSGEDEAAIAAQ